MKNIIRKIINEIKSEWNKNKIVTGYMGLVLGLAILTYLKPASTSGILSYIGISIVNFMVLALIIVGIWWFYMRKKNGK